MTDRRTHAGRADRGDLVDPLLDSVAERLVHVLVDEELDVVSTVAGEAVDAVLVADRFQRLDQQDGRLFLEVDDALAWMAGGLSSALGPPAQVLARVIVELVVLALFVVLLNLLVG